MIRNLKIRNYALIEQLEIDFIPGFITITGETGAGKSILMGALSLILGHRADTGVLMNKEQKCFVEGEFKIDGKFKQFFDINDLDFEELTLIRREILPGGKSRAFINDTPVVLSVLKDLGSQLVDVHSQHQNLQLSDNVYQMEVVDHVCGNEIPLSKYRELFSAYSASVQEYKKLKSSIDNLKGELDFYEYQFTELEAAKLIEGEMEKLELELSTLEHAEEIKSSLVESYQALLGDGKGLTLINEAFNLQRKIANFHPPSSSFSERLESAYIELKDIAAEMESIAGYTEFNPARLNQARERIDMLHSLMQKHKLKSIEALIILRNELENKISEISFSDENMEKLNKKILNLKMKVESSAEKLHVARESSGKQIEKEIVDMLQLLGIPNPTFKVKVVLTEVPDENGMDDVSFLFSANKQSPAEEISKVASGGEISRLMLCIKSLLSDYKGLPTLIFDEIDSGVSGEVAEKVGIIMKEMSGGRQVIAITHLPQVASQGDSHFLVYKEENDLATTTKISVLTEEERVQEIAKLLSGEEVTVAALSNARELLKN